MKNSPQQPISETLKVGVNAQITAETNAAGETLPDVKTESLFVSPLLSSDPDHTMADQKEDDDNDEKDSWTAVTNRRSRNGKASKIRAFDKDRCKRHSSRTPKSNPAKLKVLPSVAKKEASYEPKVSF